MNAKKIARELGYRSIKEMMINNDENYSSFLSATEENKKNILLRVICRKNNLSAQDIIELIDYKNRVKAILL